MCVPVILNTASGPNPSSNSRHLLQDDRSREVLSVLRVTNRPSSPATPSTLAHPSSAVNSAAPALDFSSFNKSLGAPSKACASTLIAPKSKSASAAPSGPPLVRRHSSFLHRTTSNLDHNSMHAGSSALSTTLASTSADSLLNAPSSHSNDGSSNAAPVAGHTHKQQMSRSASMAKTFVFGVTASSKSREAWGVSTGPSGGSAAGAGGSSGAASSDSVRSERWQDRGNGQPVHDSCRLGTWCEWVAVSQKNCFDVCPCAGCGQEE